MFKMKTGCFNALAREAATKTGFTKWNRNSQKRAAESFGVLSPNLSVGNALYPP